jgi:hypothetical protein
MTDISAPSPQLLEDFGKDLGFFIVGLALEGERILVIGGVARLDVALERL